MPGDTVVVLFGGSGSELEVCKVLNRHFISAELDDEYYHMIRDRLDKGHIEERYRLRLRQYDQKNSEAQLVLMEKQKEYSSKASN